MSEDFWVVGGRYEDTSFTKVAGGGAECRYGPYPTLVGARARWSALSMAGVDDAHVRYRIERSGSSSFWVIGGTYDSTEFKRTTDGSPEERLGPFDCRETAMDVWRAKAWASVDDGFVRYRIESA